MKIAIVMPLAEQRGGSELLLCQLIEYEKNTNVDWIAIFLENGSMVNQFRSLGIETYCVPAGHLRELHRFVPTVNRIATIARNSGAVLIFSWMGKAHLYSSLAAMIAGVPTLWYQHGIPSSPPGWMDRITTMLPAAGVLCCSKVGAAAQAKLQPSRHVRVVYPSVDLERFDSSQLLSPDEMRYKLGLPDNGPLIGIVGRLQQWKGMHILVEAMPQVLRSYPNAHCVVVGGKHDLEPDYENYLKERIRELKIDNQVILTGLQGNVPEWMQAMDIIVHASNNEPFGIVIIEAMALGKPIVAGNIGGPAEIVQDGINGLLAPYGNPDALASAILRYLDEPEFARHLGVSARERALDFSVQGYVNNFIEAIADLVPAIS
jgi:glycosyltransferase involved in cell wall biosynthesis